MRRPQSLCNILPTLPTAVRTRRGTGACVASNGEPSPRSELRQSSATITFSHHLSLSNFATGARACRRSRVPTLARSRSPVPVMSVRGHGGGSSSCVAQCGGTTAPPRLKRRRGGDEEIPSRGDSLAGVANSSKRKVAKRS
ncbi:unnamed protein product [Lampetra planeri]